ncbi:thioredoxin [Gorillibacterium sp. CAU 1737]|uniref:thioredoxin n=1 Tax=Gorillibacterium sp. CAU 1737 TaxID=3140362 RepID=UPI0032607647
MSVPTVEKDGFEKVIGTGKPALIEFGAAWCSPCRMLNPVLEELQEEFGSEVSVAKVNVDASPELASAFGVMSMPTVLLFHRGEAVEKLIGLRPKKAYQELVATAVLG